MVKSSERQLMVLIVGRASNPGTGCAEDAAVLVSLGEDVLVYGHALTWGGRLLEVWRVPLSANDVLKEWGYRAYSKRDYGARSALRRLLRRQGATRVQP